MNPYDPTQPQPGDWEAALSAIEAAEARADAVSRLRKWGSWGTAAAVATAVIWFGVRSEDNVKPQTTATAPLERAAEDQHVASFESASQPETDRATDAPNEAPPPSGNDAAWTEQLEWTALEEGPDANEAAPLLATETMPLEPEARGGASSSNAAASHGSTAAAARHLADDVSRPAAGEEASEQDRIGEFSEKSTQEGTSSRGMDGGINPLIPLGANLSYSTVCKSSLQLMVPSESAAPRQRAWGALFSWEGEEWAAALTREGQAGWFFRFGGVWDGRHRKWVATPAHDVFGALQAPRSVLSDQAIWASVGMEYRRHIKGRWGAVGRLDAQHLIARHLVEGQWGGGEQIVAGGASAWGQLKEESPWRVGWGAGCDWSVSEAHALRMTVGGYWSPTPTYDYIDWTEGIPRAAGELRLTWLWK